LIIRYLQIFVYDSRWSYNIITDGLVLNLDASNSNSYNGIGDIWYDLTYNKNNCILVNDPIFDNNIPKSIIFDGLNDYGDFYAPNLENIATIEMWVNLGINYTNGMFFGWDIYDVHTGGGNLGYNTGSGDLYGISEEDVINLNLINNWNHYVFEMRSDISYSNNKIYINILEQSLSQQSRTENEGARHFNNGYGRISGWRRGTNYNLSMKCSSFRVYNRKLSLNEIKKNYNATKTNFL
jgi:hypothetical protein